jgi:peptidoglycan/xylan/chitin deacetylase (PgdA/CDA1 family)
MLWYEELYRLMRANPLNEVALQFPEDRDTPSTSQPAQNFQAQWWGVVKRASRLTAEARAEWMAVIRKNSAVLPEFFEKRWRLLNSGELKQLAEAGITIGAHTRTHPILSLLSEEEARREIQESKVEIERALGRAVWAFAYPFGNPATIGEREFSLVRQAEYSCAFLNVEHWAGHESNPLALCRTHVTADMTIAEFSAHLSGVHTRLQRAVGG